MSWQAAIVDVAVLAAVCVLAYLKILPSEAAIAVISAVISARAALMQPPSGGAGGAAGGGKAAAAGAAVAASGAGAVMLGLFSLLRPAAHS